MKNKKDHIPWIEFAESDLEIARRGKVSSKIKYESLCFHTQQAAEKALKGVLVFHKIHFPKTHDIDFLLRLLKTSRIDFPKPIEEARYLSQFAVTARYPGEEMEVSQKEFRDALKAAILVVKWAKLVTQPKPPDTLF